MSNYDPYKPLLLNTAGLLIKPSVVQKFSPPNSGVTIYALKFGTDMLPINVVKSEDNQVMHDMLMSLNECWHNIARELQKLTK